MNSALLNGVNSLTAKDLIQIFNQTFSLSHNTVLIGGADEPVYIPADAGVNQHRIIFTRDYAASALHEIAHWLVAGDQRRLLVDYGYWYAPDGRTVAQQQAFEKVEVRPQSLEWLLSVASGRQFRVSADNLEAGLGASQSFKDAIYKQTVKFVREGISERCFRLITALESSSGVKDSLCEQQYTLDFLR